MAHPDWIKGTDIVLVGRLRTSTTLAHVDQRVCVSAVVVMHLNRSS